MIAGVDISKAEVGTGSDNDSDESESDGEGEQDGDEVQESDNRRLMSSRRGTLMAATVPAAMDPSTSAAKPGYERTSSESKAGVKAGSDTAMSSSATAIENGGGGHPVAAAPTAAIAASEDETGGRKASVSLQLFKEAAKAAAHAARERHASSSSTTASSSSSVASSSGRTTPSRSNTAIIAPVESSMPAPGYLVSIAQKPNDAHTPTITRSRVRPASPSMMDTIVASPTSESFNTSVTHASTSRSTQTSGGPTTATIQLEYRNPKSRSSSVIAVEATLSEKALGKQRAVAAESPIHHANLPYAAHGRTSPAHGYTHGTTSPSPHARVASAPGAASAATGSSTRGTSTNSSSRMGSRTTSSACVQPYSTRSALGDVFAELPDMPRRHHPVADTAYTVMHRPGPVSRSSSSASGVAAFPLDSPARETLSVSPLPSPSRSTQSALLPPPSPASHSLVSNLTRSRPTSPKPLYISTVAAGHHAGAPAVDTYGTHVPSTATSTTSLASESIPPSSSSSATYSNATGSTSASSISIPLSANPSTSAPASLPLTLGPVSSVTSGLPASLEADGAFTTAATATARIPISGLPQISTTVSPSMPLRRKSFKIVSSGSAHSRSRDASSSSSRSLTSEGMHRDGSGGSNRSNNSTGEYPSPGGIAGGEGDGTPRDVSGITGSQPFPEYKRSSSSSSSSGGGITRSLSISRRRSYVPPGFSDSGSFQEHEDEDVDDHPYHELSEAQIRKLSDAFEALDSGVPVSAPPPSRSQGGHSRPSSVADEKEYDYQLDITGSQNAQGTHEGILSPSNSLNVVGASAGAGGQQMQDYQVNAKQLAQLGEIHDGDAVDVHALSSVSGDSEYSVEEETQSEDGQVTQTPYVCR